VGVHGNGWLPQIAGLMHTCRCLSFDNRGMGRSQPAANPSDPMLPFGAPITVEQMTEDTLAIMDAAGWPSAHVIGHSLGGLIALHMALSARQRVQSLSLLCTFADGRVATRLTARMLWLGTRCRIGPRVWRRNAFLQIIMPSSELAHIDRTKLAKEFATLFGHDLADQPPIVNYQLQALKQFDATSRLGELANMPTLIMSAAHDPIARPAEGGRVLHRDIPGSRYVEFPNASHGLPIQCAAAVNSLLLEHLQRAETSFALSNQNA
jgi:pimeloyl-ACP methyl ester carboxylesterase